MLAMTRKLLPLLFLFTILLYLPSQLLADSYRCGRKLVKTGDSVGTLVKKCGQPSAKDRGTERIRIDGVDRKKRAERWYYQKSRRSIQRVIVIHDGRIQEIRMGDR